MAAPDLHDLQQQIERSDDSQKSDMIVRYEEVFHDQQAYYYDEILSDPEPVRSYFLRLNSEIYELVRGADCVVDLCCGTGKSSLPLLNRGKSVIGIDVSKAMLERYRRKTSSPRLRLIHADCTNPPLDPVQEAVLMIGGLHHIPNRKLAVESACRALRVGGLLIIHEPIQTGQSHWLLPWIRTFDAITNPLRILRSVARRLGVSKPRKPSEDERPHFTPYERGFSSAEELTSLLPAGMTVVDLRAKLILSDYQIGAHLAWFKPIPWFIAALDDRISRSGRAGWAGNTIWGVFRKDRESE